MEIQLAQILFQMLNFGAVLAVLTYFVYKPVLKLLEQRKQRITEAAKKAAAIEKEQAALADKSAVELNKAKAEAKKIIADARQAAKAEAKTLLDETRTQLKAKEAKFSADMSKLRTERLQEMDQQLKTAAITLASKVLAAEIDQKKHIKLLDQQLEQIIKNL
jgi:F-type H+-transporting ATPase subunit b